MTHDFGRFVWFELISADPQAAANFYGEVLGWKTQQMPMPNMTYTMIMQGDTAVGGFVPPPKEGVPPHWVSYVSVEDVDASAKAVIEKGGKALMDAFTVPTVGRMQPMTDNAGAAFFLFKNENGDKPAETGPGFFHWNELLTGDPEGAVAFYEGALGYSHETMDMPGGAYFVLKNGDAPRGGIVKPQAAGVPPHWQQYVTVSDCDEAVKRAEAHGGTVVSPAMDVPGVGRFALIKDPVGGVLGVITPAAPM